MKSPFTGSDCFFILITLHQSYEKEILPTSLWQTVISCLPKGTKPRDDLKNLKPISYMSILCKMVMNVIANRLKKILPDVLSPCQNGFIKDGFTGESTILNIYNIMNYIEKSK